MPTLKLEDADSHQSQSRRRAIAAMSQISGVRKLRHVNSFTGAVPKYGVEVTDEDELAQVRRLVADGGTGSRGGGGVAMVGWGF